MFGKDLLYWTLGGKETVIYNLKDELGLEIMLKHFV